MTRKKQEKKKNTIENCWEDILNDVRKGSSIVKACESRKLSTRTFYDVIESNKELKQSYTLAREDRGDTCLDKIEQYQKELKEGKIDAQTARVLIDTEKWKAGKFNQRMYGDKANIEHSGTVNILPSVVIGGAELSFDVGDDLN